jgi:hypothetical protein
MADRSGSDERESTGGMSLWVKVALIALVVVALAVLVMIAVSGGGIGGHQIPQHASPVPVDLSLWWTL